MRLRTLVGRVGLPLLLTGLATAGAGLPAYADPDDDLGPEVELLLPEQVVAVDGKSKKVEVEVLNYGEDTARDLIVRFGSSAIPASIGFVAPAGCDADGCRIDSIAPGKQKTLTFTVSPTAALPTFGANLDVVLEDGTHEWAQSAPVTVFTTKEGVDLELAPIDDYKLDPGATADVPIVFSNTGNKAPAGYGVVLVGDPFLSFPMKYSNCFTEDELEGIACVFDEPIQPDETVTLADKAPFRFKLAADTPGPSELFAGAYVVGLTEEDLAELPAGVRSARKASALEVQPLDEDPDDLPEDINDWDNVRTFTVSVSSNPADVAAIGGTFTGSVGDTRTVKVGVRNNGPAATGSILQGALLLVDVELPSGVKVTKADPDCFEDGDGKYFCLIIDNLHKGDKAEFSFTGTIESAGEPGSVKVDNGDLDPKKGNDTAVLDVKLTTAGAGGGGEDGEGLPVTGAPAGMVAAGGAALLLAGGAAFYAARRRRIVTVVD
ncbi:LPXTG cell wall anchor domain-containing protein [Actinoplanes sp. RD1]|uniref:LPXTG cell wall anchor domain-containing protein n=1 Tax=Actinoplanes sp. RD1 TaxID=3064538 RepID=UPI0027427271|nr:LPXTG cell wall anchor domain-containing protein [Actinoplanes sp. RD1]